jgi:hypothetical protein
MRICYGEMISFTAQRLMELEVKGLTGAANGERSPERINHRTATVTVPGRHAPARWGCASPSSGKAATSRPSWNRRWPFRHIDAVEVEFVLPSREDCFAVKVAGADCVLGTGWRCPSRCRRRAVPRWRRRYASHGTRRSTALSGHLHWR